MLTAVVALFMRSSRAPAFSRGDARISAPAERLAVIDGDTLRLGEQVVRLAGIVVPAHGTVCHRPDGATIDCGAAAANALAVLVSPSAVDCTVHGHDALGRPFADCTVGGRKLSLEMVAAGWARARDPDQNGASTSLRDAEAAAQAAHRGIWHANP